MANRLAVAAARISSRLQTAASEDVTYGRGANTAAVKATIDKTQHDGDITEGSVIHSVESIDFLIPKASLVLDGSAVMPERLDTIVWGSKTYIVLPFGDRKEEWVYEDPFEVQVRIHTKLKDDGA